MREISVYRPVWAPSDYVGTETQWEERRIAASIQPADTELLLEEYGERTRRMKVLYMDAGSDIRPGYGAISLSESGPVYRVEKVGDYQYGMTAIIEERAETVDWASGYSELMDAKREWVLTMRKERLMCAGQESRYISRFRGDQIDAFVGQMAEWSKEEDDASRKTGN